ncbi:MAG: hypothetical protein U0168_19165 [Nannocystaceae bacterium]
MTPTPAAATATKALPAPDEDELLTPNEAIAKHYGPKFRPTHNPSRFNLVARLLFANAGGESSPGGRFGGATVDLGQSWNRFGYAATISAWGGATCRRRAAPRRSTACSASDRRSAWAGSRCSVAASSICAWATTSTTA